MKIHLLLALILQWIVLCSSLSFIKWCVQYNRQYGSPGETAERERIYNENVKLIEELNIQHREREFIFAINQFADMTSSEFRHRVLMRPTRPKVFKHLHMDCGMFGGWPYLAYQYIMKTGGIESESDYPYCSGKGTCYPCVPKGWNNTRCGPPPTYCNDTYSCFNKLDKNKFVPGLRVKEWIAVEKSETEMVNALLKQGPLSVLIDAELLQFYHSGIWDPFVKCDPTSLDHAVLLVGYGTYNELHLIKNSWGKKWGEDGYFRLIRGKGKCGVDQQVTSAILD